MYKLVQTNQFRKDLKKIAKRNRDDLEKTFEVLEMLQKDGVEGIPANLRPHRLNGKYQNNWECHIKPDLLIIWIQTVRRAIESPHEIKLIRLGSHSDLFK